MNLLGIDIGGTKTSVCVGNEHGEIRAADRISSRTSGTLDAYFFALAELCRKVLRNASLAATDIAAVGISAPGPMDVKRGILIAPPNNPGWRDVPIVQKVRDMLERPVYFNNDANACAVAEFVFGGHGVQNLVYLTCSTGIGGGIIANGRLIQGATDTGGEVGHQIIDVNGPVCGCGMRGCLEAYVGGRNVADRLREKIRAGKISTSILDKAGGDYEKIDVKFLAQAAREGDSFAVKEWEEFVERMAQGIGNLIMILNPDLIILGTIAIYEGDFLMKPLHEKLAKYTWKWPREACRIIPSRLGSKIGDLGALAVAVAGMQEAPATAAAR